MSIVRFVPFAAVRQLITVSGERCHLGEGELDDGAASRGQLLPDVCSVLEIGNFRSASMFSVMHSLDCRRLREACVSIFSLCVSGDTMNHATLDIRRSEQLGKTILGWFSGHYFGQFLGILA